MSTKYGIVVVSMASAADRRALIAADLAERPGENWSFFDALSADDEVAGLEVSADRQTARFGRPLGRAEIGCFRSHYRIMDDFSRAGTSPWLLVLEDDVWLDPKFDIDEVVAFADAHARPYVRLFAKMYKPARIIGMLSGFRQVLRFSTDPYGTQAYLVSREGAKAFVDSVSAIDRPIDDELGRFWRHGLDPVCVFPFPVVERAVSSSVEGDRASGGLVRARLRPDLVAHRLAEKARKLWCNARRR
jgi:glycosyl transferase family 25